MTDATLTDRGQRMEAVALLKNVRSQLIAQHELVDINSRESMALAYVITEAGAQLRKLESGMERIQRHIKRRGRQDAQLIAAWNARSIAAQKRRNRKPR